jgi:phosphatidate cytidylyltransferase
LSNLTIRILVAAVGIPLVLALTLAGGFYFLLFVAVISTIGLNEFFTLARARGAHPQIILGSLFGLGVNIVFLRQAVQLLAGTSPTFPAAAPVVLAILFLLFIPLILVSELFRNVGSALTNISTTIAGVAYVSLALGALVGVRELFAPGDAVFPVHDDAYALGGYSVIAILASIWVCDSAAYFAGRAIGKHKLFPRVSPNKTWEGAVAGFLGAVLAFVGASYLGLPYLSQTHAIVCGAIVGIFGQVGDLAESLLKRDAGVKDSSSIIPGHGGVLDRFDSLILVSPILFVYLKFVVL